MAAILLHTPKWVFIAFAALVWLGLRQMMTRRVPAARTGTVALAMTAFSLQGSLGAFPQVDAVLLAWPLAWAAGLLAVLALPLPAGSRYEPDTGHFVVPGSAVPLLLMMAIFVTRFALGVTLARYPAWSADTALALTGAGLSGVFSGVFAGRAARLGRLALRSQAPAASQA